MSCLILVSGHQGSGKSTLAKKLIREFNFVYFEKEIINQVLSPNKRDYSYHHIWQPIIIQILLGQAASNLALGNNVLIDFAITYFLIDQPLLISQIENIVHQHDAQLILLECVVNDEKLLKERMIKRGEKWDAERLTSDASWREFITQMHFGKENPLGVKYPEHYCKIDSTEDPERCFELAKIFINKKL